MQGFSALVSGLGWVGVLVSVLALAGCAFLKPLPDKPPLEDRLAAIPARNLPLAAPVEIRWNDYQVPYVIAGSDRDAAFALGLVHAHLRIAQMEIVRRAGSGRIAEMLGPTFTKIDGALRAIGLNRAAEASLAQMPEASLEWLQRFADGINHYQAAMKKEPHEYALMNLDNEPWTPADVLLVGKLGSIDVNWFEYFKLLPKRGRSDWPEIWQEALAVGAENPVSFESDAREANALTPGPHFSKDAARLQEILRLAKRSGSNSTVVGKQLTQNGSAYIASDPHLGFLLPNVWLLAGIKTPSQQVVGFMPVGIPIFALGRNENIAWGGTNLYAASSDMIDVTDLGEASFTSESHDLEVRFWFDKKTENRLSAYGPVVTDSKLMREAFGIGEDKHYALRWIGHLPSDEITTFLKVNRAQNFEEFRTAFATFSLPGQNMMYADKEGNIGHVVATTLPRRAPGLPDDLVLSPEESDPAWKSPATSLELPAAYNPAEGFLASANNKPAEWDIPVGFFFAQPDRIIRLQNVMQDVKNVTLEDMIALQNDVFSERGLDTKNRLAARLTALEPRFSPEGAQKEAWELIRSWDGYFLAESRKALAVEIFFNSFAPGLAEVTDREADFEEIRDSTKLKVFIQDTLDQAPDEAVLELSRKALRATAKVLAEYKDWGAIHRLRLNHPLANIPLIGGRYRFVDLPSDGSSETLMKTAHGPINSVHGAQYGSQARHISDMADPDGNYFVLAGGQDGWLNSANFADQTDLWDKGDYIRMPLSETLIERDFPYVTHLLPE